MKNAAREDAWRRVGPEWPEGTGFTTLEVVNVPGMAPARVALAGGLSIICGSNAAGKTRLLAAIMRSIETGDRSEVILEGGPAVTSVGYVDNFWLLQKQRLSLGQDKALEDRVAQAGMTAMRAEDVRLASYLLGRDYQQIEFAELEATDDDQVLAALAPEDPLIGRALAMASDVIPYFEVRRGGRRFDSTKLSQGELAALTLLWLLARTPKGDVLCVDEPETFMAPISAQRCLDVLAYFCHRREINCFVSSHSYLGLASTPQTHVLLLAPAAPGVVRLQTATDASLWSTLRLAPPRPIVFVVEDGAARQWLLDLLAAVDFAHREFSDIWVGGDAAAVANAAAFPSDAKGARCSFWGVLDGNERATRRRARCGRLLYLPSDKSPEELIIDVLLDGEAEMVEISRDRARACIAQHEGENPHDVVAAIAGELGLLVTSLRQIVLRAWLETTEIGRQEKAAFARSLEEVQLPEGLAPAIQP